MRAEVALEYPVETVLSGPAASVVGAGFLSGQTEFVVADMGGTTTDVAVVRDGRPVIRAEGAVIGGWRTMVEAVDVHTCGLGGDSEVGLDSEPPDCRAAQGACRSACWHHIPRCWRTCAGRGRGLPGALSRRSLRFAIPDGTRASARSIELRRLGGADRGAAAAGRWRAALREWRRCGGWSTRDWRRWRGSRPAMPCTCWDARTGGTRRRPGSELRCWRTRSAMQRPARRGPRRSNCAGACMNMWCERRAASCSKARWPTIPESSRATGAGGRWGR